MSLFKRLKILKHCDDKNKINTIFFQIYYFGTKIMNLKENVKNI